MKTQIKGKVTMPSRRLLDADFKYKKADHTNLAETFARVRAEQRARLLPVLTPQDDRRIF